jgi:hypothetical protein
MRSSVTAPLALLLASVCAAAAAEPDRPSASLPAFEISSPYVGNLVHWIDNLAGSSQGKTIAAYRRWWTRRFGMPSEADMRLLRDWVGIRWKEMPEKTPPILNDSGCLPQREEGLAWRQLFEVRSFEAAGVDEFLASLASDLTPGEIATLRRVLDAFRPRFDEAMKEMTFLPPFERRLRDFLDHGELRSFLAEVATMFGVDPSAHPPGRLRLMALPEEGSTHAQADGRDLLIEIRPGDTPDAQIQVIAHETAHYLWRLLPAVKADALAKEIHAAVPEGPLVWRLLREALPTALGQGVAEARLAPRRFSPRNRWYHIDGVDAVAKEIYPAVASALRDHRTIFDGLASEIARSAARSAPVTGASAGELFAESFVAAGDGMEGASMEIRSRVATLPGWPRPITDAEAASLVSRYECLTGIVLVGPKDLENASLLPAPFAPPSAVPPPPKRSGVQVARRPAGGAIAYLVAASPRDADRIAGFFLGMPALPPSPVWLDPPPAP